MNADALRTRFLARFGVPASAAVSAPSTLVLLGDETGSSHLPSLALALDRRVSVLAAPADAAVVRADGPLFGSPIELTRANAGAVRGPARYLAGVLAAIEELAPGRGASLWVESSLADTDGAAEPLTVALAAALTHAWGVECPEDELVAYAERALGRAPEDLAPGTRAVAAARAASILRVNLEPPAARNVALGEGLVFVLAGSGDLPADPAATRTLRHERAIGARLGAAMLADQVGLPIGRPPRLRDVAGVDVVDILVDDLPEKISAQEVAHGVDANVALLVTLADDHWDPRAKVAVRRPVRYVLGEAERVDAGECALRDGDWAAFGRILDQSHNALREDLRVSSKGLDALCAAMRRAGALGARLLGEGAPGTAIAVCAPEQAEAVVAAAVGLTSASAFVVTPAAGLELL